MTPKHEILSLRSKGLSYGKIANKLDCPKATVAWTCRNPDAPCQEDSHYDWNAIQAYYDNGNGVRNCIKHFGMSNRTWDKAVRRGAIKLRPIGSHIIPLCDLLVENRPQTSRNHLKKRLVKEHILKDECDECGLPSLWNGKPLSLQLEHKNGKKNDNRLENLCLLCPNCHSQTPTFAGRNKHKISP